MKKILLAAAITITSLAGLSAPSLAASTTVVVKRVERVDHHRPMARPMYRHHDCYVITVKHRDHGRVVVRKTRVCR